MTKIFCGMLATTFLFLGTANGQILTKKPLETASDFVEQIKKAQNVPLFLKKEAIAFDLEMTINGKPTSATLTTKTNSGKMRLQYADGKIIVFDGKKIWRNSTDATGDKQARFDIFMWQYFFMAPFKMDDAGTNWQLSTDKILDNNDYARAKLTFKNGTGDTPNDWFLVHRNKATDFLAAMAYIVTFGNKTISEAEKRPNGIMYDDFTAVEGIQFATTWTFSKWSEQRGFYEPKGSAKIKNIRFIKPTADTFAPPAGSKEIVL
jgi:hypothetical protein